jgi:hypothetical protein
MPSKAPRPAPAANFRKRGRHPLSMAQPKYPGQNACLAPAQVKLLHRCTPASASSPLPGRSAHRAVDTSYLPRPERSCRNQGQYAPPALSITRRGGKVTGQSHMPSIIVFSMVRPILNGKNAKFLAWRELTLCRVSSSGLSRRRTRSKNHRKSQGKTRKDRGREKCGDF